MRTQVYSHNTGLKKVPGNIQDPLLKRLNAGAFQLTKGATIEFRAKLGRVFKELGWSSRVQVAQESKISITALNGDVGLCLQLGNMARFYADLLKIQVLFFNRRISSSIYVLPTRNAARELGKNVTNYERMIRELQFYKDIITVPIIVVGIENEDK